MATETKIVEPKIKEYAEGWITEREGTLVPGFLKLSYVVIAASAIAYFLLYMYGDTAQADRGPLVKAMNAATEASATLMYAIAALVVIYGIIVVLFAFGKSHD